MLEVYLYFIYKQGDNTLYLFLDLQHIIYIQQLTVVQSKD